MHQRIRVLLLIFVVGLVISGASAIPLETELKLIARLIETNQNSNSDFAAWIIKVKGALIETNAKYPFIAYGTDWL